MPTTKKPTTKKITPKKDDSGKSLFELKSELADLKIKLQMNQLKDTSLIKKAKKKIAILKTKSNL